MIYDVLVIGAGPAGSTAARLLARAGWTVALVEKSVFPRRKVCGEFVSATSLPLLNPADVGGGFGEHAGPEIRRVALFTGRTVTESPMPRVVNGAGAWGRAIGREHLDGLLRDAAVRAGATLFQPFKLVDMERVGGLHHAALVGPANSLRLTARRIIAANGSWERGPLSEPAPAHRPSDLLAFKAHFHGGDLPPDLMPLLMFPGGYGGMASTDGGRVGLSCCIRRDTLARTRQTWPGLSAGEAVLAHIRRHCEGVRQSLVRAELDGPILSAGPIRPGIRPAYRAGMFRVGNAAGEAHPAIAEGISMAMQSSSILCRALIENERVLGDDGRARAIGHAYSADWRAHFGLRLRAASAIATVAMHPAAAALAGSAVATLPKLLTWGARLSGKSAQKALSSTGLAAPQIS
ncbi:MAG TPA: NAD(P)/FAD-dependent oxidoreductase [Caulobacteraceae bacterium]|nr:NAD(P)/FAD-dependent oxidoreductase [Caulobacteraceae bacterium]